MTPDDRNLLQQFSDALTEQMLAEAAGQSDGTFSLDLGFCVYAGLMAGLMLAFHQPEWTRAQWQQIPRPPQSSEHLAAFVAAHPIGGAS